MANFIDPYSPIARYLSKERTHKILDEQERRLPKITTVLRNTRDRSLIVFAPKEVSRPLKTIRKYARQRLVESNVLLGLKVYMFDFGLFEKILDLREGKINLNHLLSLECDQGGDLGKCIVSENKNLMMEILQTHPEAIFQVSSLLKDDVDLWRIAIRKNPGCAGSCPRSVLKKIASSDKSTDSVLNHEKSSEAGLLIRKNPDDMTSVKCAIRVNYLYFAWASLELQKNDGIRVLCAEERIRQLSNIM